MATDAKKTGLSLPTGIFQPTTQPEPEEQGGVDPKPAKARPRKKAAAASAEKVEDVKLYLTEDVRFRLRMLAFQRGKKISTVANEVLDRALPRWNLERTE